MFPLEMLLPRATTSQFQTLVSHPGERTFRGAFCVDRTVRVRRVEQDLVTHDFRLSWATGLQPRQIELISEVRNSLDAIPQWLTIYCPIRVASIGIIVYLC